MSRLFSVLMLLFALSFSTTLKAQMSDEQVVEYTKNSAALGKGEKQIGQELMARGVTMEQLQRIKQKYESSHGSETVPADNQVGSGVRRKPAVDSGENIVDAVSVSLEDPTQGAKLADARKVFGHDIFRTQNLTFEPNENTATPENYVLGPGDEVVIEIWGDNEASVRQTISPEGKIMVSQIGPIFLSGKSIKEANNYVRKLFAQKYAGVDNRASDISVTLGQIRTIQVNIFGEVAVPGTYRLSALSSLFNALYRAGGITDRGSLRAIEVVRNGRKVATVDLYPFLFNGKQEKDVKLFDGDVIRVPLYGNLVNIEGQVKKPMYYEMKEGETIKSLIEYAGGFDIDAIRNEVRLVRQSSREREIRMISDMDFSHFKLEAGDVISVLGNTLDRYANRVEIRGSVFRPGMYELGADIKTVKDLVRHADGLLEDAFTDRVRLLRLQSDFTPEVLPLNLTGIMSGIVADVPLKKNDILVISNIHELQDLGEISIDGYVARPGTYAYADHTTIEDLILQAGGLLDGASVVRVEVSRRLKNHYSEMPSDTLAEIFTFGFDPTLKVGNRETKFELKPYDVVRIRKSPGYSEQESVSISGEVAFPGNYTLMTNNDRLSDIVRRAGGATKSSYLKGAVLMRAMNEDERMMRQHMTNQDSGRDSLDVDKQLGDNFSVGIELEKALQNPGSTYDVVLRAGDRIMVPKYNAIVSVEGSVLYPNAVSYLDGKSLSYYIEQAGGYDRLAKKSKVYVAYMNGHVVKGKHAKIEPGCRIIVPSKPDKVRNAAQNLQTTATIVSMASVVATLINAITR